MLVQAGTSPADTTANEHHKQSVRSVYKEKPYLRQQSANTIS